MGRARNQKWLARMTWSRRRFADLTRVGIVWLMIYDAENAPANFVKAVNSVYETRVLETGEK